MCLAKASFVGSGPLDDQSPHEKCSEELHTMDFEEVNVPERAPKTLAGARVLRTCEEA